MCRRTAGGEEKRLGERKYIRGEEAGETIHSMCKSTRKCFEIAPEMTTLYLVVENLYIYKVRLHYVHVQSFLYDSNEGIPCLRF